MEAYNGMDSFQRWIGDRKEDIWERRGEDSRQGDKNRAAKTWSREREQIDQEQRVT